MILGEGRLSWPARERRSDRYGTVILMHDGDSFTEPSGYVQFFGVQDGQRGELVAIIRETRESTHIGDLFRGIYPTTPEVGDEITLGEGALFLGVSDQIPYVGLKPDDGRDSGWLDPEALYRCHEQTVRLAFRPSGGTT